MAARAGSAHLSRTGFQRRRPVRPLRFWQDPNHDRGSRPIVHRYPGRAKHGRSALVLPGAGLAGGSGITLACTVSTREEVDTALAAAVAAGATPVADATDRSWGGRSAFMADPEGNRWEITWSPRATFDTRGALLSWD